jgi:(p)ppGpp synthase/HD superfamily hydrolase
MLNATVLTDRFDRALLYAAHGHGGQVRKGTSIPYVAHPLAVAATYGGSEDMAIAALLHDAVSSAIFVNLKSGPLCGRDSRPQKKRHFGIIAS